MSDLKCEVIKVVEKDKIYCAYCDRHYVLYKLKHRCHPLIKCNIKKISYEEEYLPPTSELVYDSNEAAAICEACKKRKQKAESARKTVCPGCEYVGYYVRGPNNLCPICVNKTKVPDTPQQNTATNTQPVTNSTQSSPLIPLTLFLRLSDNRTSDMGLPAEDKCSGINVYAATEESLMTNFWFVETFTTGDHADFHHNMKNLSDWLRKMSEKYIFHWSETTSLDWYLLKYLYHTYTDETRYPLC